MTSAPAGLVNRILAPSFVDGPGARMAVFLQGCGFSCLHCHNPETWNPCGGCGLCVPGCPGGALEQVDGRIVHHPELCQSCDRCLQACPSHASPRCQSLAPAGLAATARPWKPYLDGLTFTGGECTRQAEFLLAAMPLIKAATGWSVLLDTNGEAPAGTFQALAAAADGFLFDLKALGPAHRVLTGADPEPVLANLELAAAAGKLVEVRTVLVPGHTDDPAMLREMALRVRGLGPEVPLVVAPFRPQGVRGPLAGVPAPDPARVRDLCAPAAAVLGDRFRLRGQEP